MEEIIIKTSSDIKIGDKVKVNKSNVVWNVFDIRITYLLKSNSTIVEYKLNCNGHLSAWVDRNVFYKISE